MTAYYKRILHENEYVLFVTRLHWVIYARALACLVPVPLLLGTVFAATDAQAARIAALGVGLILAALGLYAGIRAWLRQAGTEIAVTDRRVIYKQGLLVRHTVEMNVSRIETVDVDQGLTGRLLGYGDVTFRGTGGGIETIRQVARPLDLRNAALAE